MSVRSNNYRFHIAALRRVRRAKMNGICVCFCNASSSARGGCSSSLIAFGAKFDSFSAIVRSCANIHAKPPMPTLYWHSANLRLARQIAHTQIVCT